LEDNNAEPDSELNIIPNNTPPISVSKAPKGLSLGGIGGIGGLGLNLGGMVKADYQDEFMAHIDEFSESWR
jgi:hypothetical protein